MTDRSSSLMNQAREGRGSALCVVHLTMLCMACHARTHDLCMRIYLYRCEPCACMLTHKVHNSDGQAYHGMRPCRPHAGFSMYLVDSLNPESHTHIWP